MKRLALLLALVGPLGMMGCAPRTTWLGINIYDNRPDSPKRSAFTPRWELGLKKNKVVVWREIPDAVRAQMEQQRMKELTETKTSTDTAKPTKKK